MSLALDLAFDLATQPHFDSLHDPDPSTGLIEPYHDPIGYPTQGYGRLLSRVKWEPLSKYPAITVEQAKANCMSDLTRASRSTHRLIQTQLSPQQWAALYDFTFNCGGGNLETSQLRMVINRGDLDLAPPQFLRFVYGGGIKWPGLVRRRKAEVVLWLS